MARINVEDSLWSDPKLRFTKFCIGVGDEVKALGYVVIAWRLAQKYWCPDLKPIPMDAWLASGIPECLVTSGLAEVWPEGIYIKGSEAQFAWWFQRRDAGFASGEARKKTAKKLRKNSPKTNPPKTERPLTVVERSLNGREPLLSSLAKHTESRAAHSTSAVDSPPPVSCSNSSTPDGVLEAPPLNPVGGSEKISSEKKRKPRAGSEVPGENVARVIATYVKSWQGRHGAKARPDVSGRVQGLARTILRDNPVDYTCDLIQAYCQMKDDWFDKKKHDFPTFYENITKVSNALGNGDKDSMSPTDLFLFEMNQKETLELTT